MTTRPEQDRIYFTQLDGLRCLAVMSVLICHWITYRAVVLIPLGSMGVNLFFVLSGFLITRILLISKEQINGGSILPSIKRFYIRRTLRIFPIYYLTILFLFAINFPPATRPNIGWLATYTFNLKFSLPHVWESDQLNYLVHLWSLSVEEQFYIFFPLLVFLIPKGRMKLLFFSLILIAVLSRLALYLFHGPQNAIYALTPCCFDSFGIGALLAYYLLYEPDLLKKLLEKNALFIVSILVFIADIVYSRNFIKGYGECRTVVERLLFSICCFWIVGKGAVASYSGLFRKFLLNRFVVYIGKISYGLYIYHHFASPFLDTILGHFHFYLLLYGLHNHMILRAFVLFAGTLLFAALSWRFIEAPINNLKNKFDFKVKLKLV